VLAKREEARMLTDQHHAGWDECLLPSEFEQRDVIACEQQASSSRHLGAVLSRAHKANLGKPSLPRFGIRRGAGGDTEVCA
jgi:hypothetical protein